MSCGGLNTKCCNKCRESKPLDSFGVDRRQPCKACRSKQNRQPDQLAAQRVRTKRWADSNRDHVRAYARRWAAKNRLKLRQYQRELYARPDVKAKASARAKAFAAAHPEHAKAKRVNAKAKRRQRGLTRKITAAEMAALIARDKVCYLCGRKNTPETHSVDHVVPLAKGGLHEFVNLRLVHLECNLKKRDRLVLLPFEVAS